MRDPDHIIGPKSDPYLYRWYLWPRNRFCNLYLHKFLRDDDDRALHDHPWWFISVLLKGTYREVLSDQVQTTWRKRLSIVFRPATHRHRVVIGTDTCWTLVLTGPRVRDWGFWCPQGFVHWRDFTTGPKGEEIGKGCGE